MTMTLPLVASHRIGGAGSLGRSSGVRSVVLTTRGRRTGEPREAPLYAIEDGDRLVLVGSNGGRERDPAWVGNLRAEPNASVRVGRRVRPVRAYEATGDEHERLWAVAVEAFPMYARFAARTSRSIPLFVLEALVKPSG